MTRILLIVSIILLTIHSNGQARMSLPTDGTIVHLFPNPATSAITFDLNKGADKGYTLLIYSFLGKKMYEAANFSQRTTITLSDFTRGVYIYQVHDRSGKMVESGKFQVSK